RGQLIRPSAAEAVLTCAVGAAAGAVVGRQLAAFLLTKATHAHVAPGAPLGVAVAAAAVFAFCLVIIVWPALRPAGIATVRIRRGRQAPVAGILAAGFDVGLVVLAALAVRELHAYSAAQAAAGNGIDPVIAVAPAITLAGLAIIPLRLLPLSARVLERLTARGRRFGAAMANWEISRRPVRQSGPVLLVILAVGTGTLALSQYTSWRQSVTDQAAFAAGADVRVSPPQAVSLPGAARLSTLPGVTAAMPVSQFAYTTGSDVVDAIGSRQAAATVLLRHDLAAVPAARLWRMIEPEQVQPAGLAQGAPLAGGLTLPGHPVRLGITASLAPSAGRAAAGLGPAQAQVTVQDASGASYVLQAGSLPADGRSHQLVVQLAPPGGARYPLRLLGLSVIYNLPLYRQVQEQAPAVLTIANVADSPAAAGPIAQQVAPGSVLAGWQTKASSPDAGFIQLYGGGFGKGRGQATSPLMLGAQPSGHALAITLDPGNGPQDSLADLRFLGLTGLTGEVTLTLQNPTEPIAAIATKAFLSDTNLQVGSVVAMPVNGVTVQFRIVASMLEFPSVAGTGALIADQAAIQDDLASQNTLPLPVTQWWLHTATGEAPAGLPRGSSVTVAAQTARSLRSDPLFAAPVQAALPISAAAALLAAFGFCVHVAASSRSRRSQRALLAALGVPATAQARLFCAEELMLSLPAAAVGIGVGVGLAYLLIPSLSLAANSGLPVPSVLVQIPLAWAVALALALTAIPVLAAAVSVLRQPDPAAELRAVEAA
ncbi:MAG TPA: FtsX-like permease family protein, partial [Streptosporangiaceae bacterium]